MNTPYKLGWVPDLPDYRDYVYKTPRIAIPKSADLRGLCPPVYDQGQLGSCTANAVAASIQYSQIKQRRSQFPPSRLFIYYNARLLMGTAGYDSGSYIRDGVKTANKQGACPESVWAYNVSKFAARPPVPCYNVALKERILQYERMDNSSISQLQACLASGSPFVFGFSVYESFMSQNVSRTGIMPMPTNRERFLGGHAVMAVGYDSKKGVFIVRNSWGRGWGMGGYFTMPYQYITNTDLCDDFWKISLVS